MKRCKTIFAEICVISTSIFLSAACSFSQNLPTAKSIAGEMGIAWNIGNTMEAIGGPTTWGNPVPTKLLIDSVKAAGFKTIRIPCAWDGNADQTSLEIKPEWMAQVKQVVDYCIKDSLFVVLNIHWDGGWLESSINDAVTDLALRQQIQKKQGAYWRQIASEFRDYDRHLLFASTNEPDCENEEAFNVLMSFHKIFIDTVRATGGNNSSRTLILSGPSTSLEKTNNWMKTLPNDKIADRLMVEVHYYPYQFCLMSKDETWGKVFYYWGKQYHSKTDTDRNPTWGEESYTDSVFNLMKEQFTDKNIPVLLGEFGAKKRLTLTGENLNRHILSRRYFYQYVVSSSKKHGIIPAAWDAGGKGDETMTIFDRNTGAVYDLGLLNAIRYGWGLQKLPGDTSLPKVVTGENSMKILYSSKDSLYGQVSLPVVKTDVSNYDSIIMRAYVNGETKYDSSGINKNGYMNLNIVTMSKDWTWRQASFSSVKMNEWNNYCVPIGTDTTKKDVLVPADPTKIDFFAIQAFSRGYRGTIYVDWIVFKSKNGSIDTVYNFNQAVPEEGKGNVESIELIATSKVETDTEWKTATSKYPYESGILSRVSATGHNKFHAFSANRKVMAVYKASNAGKVNVNIKNLQGKTIKSYIINARTGVNTIEIPINYSGVMILQFKQGNQKFTGKVVCQ